MAYDKKLAERLDKLKSTGRPDIQKKNMFGGIAYLLNGNMCYGVHKDFLVLRRGEDHAEKVLKNPIAKPMDLTGKVMKGWVMVSPEGFADSRSLKSHVDVSIKFVSTLPPK